jgi:hypothetical protein
MFIAKNPNGYTGVWGTEWSHALDQVNDQSLEEIEVAPSGGGGSIQQKEHVFLWC